MLNIIPTCQRYQIKNSHVFFQGTKLLTLIEHISTYYLCNLEHVIEPLSPFLIFINNANANTYLIAL